ncbi:hypothetical protein ACFSEO_00355 [Agromyces cerinus subsp. nitratus]|uniref:hypothetical protein n=1 Tax=Agromyces cerinus TaxID=33878 RepID=UPI003633806F
MRAGGRRHPHQPVNATCAATRRDTVPPASARAAVVSCVTSLSRASESFGRGAPDRRWASTRR